MKAVSYYFSILSTVISMVVWAQPSDQRCGGTETRSTCELEATYVGRQVRVRFTTDKSTQSVSGEVVLFSSANPAFHPTIVLPFPSVSFNCAADEIEARSTVPGVLLKAYLGRCGLSGELTLLINGQVETIPFHASLDGGNVSPGSLEDLL